MEKAWESIKEVFEVEKAVVAVSDNISSQTGVAVLVLMLFWCRTRGSCFSLSLSVWCRNWRQQIAGSIQRAPRVCSLIRLIRTATSLADLSPWLRQSSNNERLS